MLQIAILTDDACCKLCNQAQAGHAFNGVSCDLRCVHGGILCSLEIEDGGGL